MTCFQRWIDTLWERLFAWRPSFLQRLFFCFLIVVAGFGLTSFLFRTTELYFTFVVILCVLSISLFSGLRLALVSAVILSLLGDYFFIPPLGGIFDNQKSFEHFFLLCSASFFTSLIVSSMRSALNKVQRARTEAEGASISMEHVLALVSHDIRNPLNVIKMGSQLILENSENSENRDIVVKMLRNLDQVDSMIQSLLDVARIRVGKTIPLNFQNCDLRAEVSRMIETQALVSRERLMLIAREPIWGEWGSEGIRRALENLIANALKYGAPETPIQIILVRHEHSATLSVHNQGEEIPAAEQEALFQAFHRTRDTEKGGIKGWGLGLALVKGIAEAHEGTVRVESHSGLGTTFILELPLRRGETEEKSH